MRWNENEASHHADENKNKAKEKPKKREVPLSGKGQTSLEALSNVKNRPFLGGNPNG